MAFALNLYPITYMAKYNPQTKNWDEQWLESDKIPHDELMAMSEDERKVILDKRNQMGTPSVSYTSQYAYSCFEGMKGFPTKDGGVAIFRPEENAKRFYNSMKGMYCPPFPVEMYVKASVEFVKKNAELGYVPKYNPEWEKTDFANAESIYIRPFMNSEGAIGVGCAQQPCVIICATTVSAYFKAGLDGAVITERIRATPHGTGYIKCASNYVISALAKKEAEEKGFVECVYLDAVHRKYFQEGSSCNIFFVLKDKTIVTPELSDTILPGITRKSVIVLAKEKGYKVEERQISVKEVQKKAIECFVTGTAAGISPMSSITDLKGKKTDFGSGFGPVAKELQHELKGRQYGAIADPNNWNTVVIKGNN
ncbi:aminotransferase class IV [Treponema pectinovorum]|uniref:aminotransferase class IV n=1 Tax=Treponema pectinovorum TaxID=164 RepID=UPI003D8BF62D